LSIRYELLVSVELGNAFGEAKSANVKRTADKEEFLKNAGSLRACVLKNPRFELSLETLFDDSVDAPGLGERIAFPLVGVVGRILDVEPKWDQSGARMLSITATSWDSLGNSGAGSAQAFDGETWSGVTDTVTVVAGSPPTLTSATVDTTGEVLTLVFSEAVTVPIGTSGLQLNASVGGAFLPMYSSGNGSATVVFSIASPILDAETVTLDFTQIGVGIRDMAGTALAAITDRAVTNNSTQV